LQEAKADADEPAQMSILVEELFNFALLFLLYVCLLVPEREADGSRHIYSYDK